MPLPPPGVICAVRGHNEPFPEGCQDRTITAHAKRDASSPIARVRLSDLDITWGFFEDKGRSWIHVDSRGMVLEGFADTVTERFALVRDIPAVPDHVWLKGESPVTVRGKGHGIAVKLKGDFPGVDAFEADTSCEAIRYGFAPPTPAGAAATPAPPPLAPETTRISKGRSLPFAFEPGGPIRRITNTNAHPLPVVLNVVEHRGSYSRLVFETDHARFDVWVEDAQLDEDSVGFGAGGLGLCGSGVDDGFGASARTLEDSPVAVGAKPTATGTVEAISIKKGTSVALGKRMQGYVEITPIRSAIQPPKGQSFWLLESLVSSQP